MYTTQWYTGEQAPNIEVLYWETHKYLDKDLIQVVSHILSQRHKGTVLHTQTTRNSDGEVVHDSTQMLIPGKNSGT